MSNKRKSASVKHTPFRSILGLIAGIIGLMFGFGLLNITGEAQDLGAGEKALRIVFAIVWFTFWIGAMVYNVLNLYSHSRSKRGETQPAAPGDGPPAKAGFETKLRGLESLRKDGLISEEEYKKKRDDLMQEKW